MVSASCSRCFLLWPQATQELERSAEGLEALFTKLGRTAELKQMLFVAKAARSRFDAFPALQ
jgi:hypothetical protein